MVNSGFPRFDALYSDFGSLTSGGHVIPAWSPDGKWLAYVDGPADDRHGWLVDTVTGDRQPLVDTGRVREGLRRLTGETPSGQGLPFAEVTFTSPGTISARSGDRRVLIDLATGGVTSVPDEDVARRTPRVYAQTVGGGDARDALETAAPDGRFLISTRGGNIILRSAYDGRETPWTTDGAPGHEWRFDVYDPISEWFGHAGPVTDWSPDGMRLAAYKVDFRAVPRSPRTLYQARGDTVTYRHDSKAGGTMERYALYVLDLQGRAPVELDLGDTTGTFPVFAGWFPDGSHVLVLRMSRDMRRADVLCADTTTGSVREIFSETSETFVRIRHDVVQGRKLLPRLTPDGTRILWSSERDGWRHLYLYDVDGGTSRRLTDGEWPVDVVERCTDEHVYFTAHHDPARPYDVHVCRVPLAGGPVERLTDGEGVHRPRFAPDTHVFVDTWSTPARPPVSVLRRADGTRLAELSRADITRLEEVGWTPPEQFTVVAADGRTELWGVMYFPADFDPSRRYPFVEYVYGGPQSAAVRHDWDGSFYTRPARALAQMGYVTAVIDGRGTPERSKAFHDAVCGNWGGALVEDHPAAVTQLAERHAFIDGDRVGVAGHSWGGYAALRLLADRPDVYRAGLSNAPVFDLYRSSLYEAFLGFPQDDRSAYDAADGLSRAARLERPFMIACGTSDILTWSDSVRMVEALIRAGKQHEFVVLPGQPHWFDETHDGYFWRKAADFFSAHLGRPEPGLSS